MTLAKRCGFGCFLALFCIAPCEASDKGNERNVFLTRDGQLTAKLMLRDAQAGVAGESGTVWIIDPEGTFSISRFFNNKVNKSCRTGQLTQEQLATLAKVLTAQEFFELPSEVGHGPEVNPHRITISFGEKTSTLTLGAGQDIMKAAPQGGEQTSPQGRLSAIAQAIFRAVEDDKLDCG